MRIDPRWWQIGSLAALLLWGITVLRFDVTLWRVMAVVAVALGAQWVCSRLARISFEWKSAMITALGLSMLVRTNGFAPMLATIVIAIASKFVVRFNGKHIFNPANGAVVLMMLLTDQVWLSPGQWGSVAFFGFLVMCAGGVVVHRSARSDVTIAFLAFWSAILIGRSLALGDPMSIPLHRLENGALLIFAFFMISDPKTTPNSRVGRILFAALVAAGAWFVQFRLFGTNALFWSLAACSPLVPFIDRLIPHARFEWHIARLKEPIMRTAATLFCVISLTFAPSVFAFCGFYVAKGDAKLFNKASQVVLVRDGERTVLTMASDFKGDPKEFALVVPVPTVLQKGQIRVADKALIDHLDAYSAPRLVEYHDSDPCAQLRRELDAVAQSAPAAKFAMADRRAKSLGVTIEAQYTVGEYDILILSARESSGLTTWLRENGYRLPGGAREVLGSYIGQNLKFFVAKVNLAEQSRLGFSYLRPIQVAFESPKFMLPIRLGTVNASGPQEMFVYALTRRGRVETTNYRTIRLPSNVELPVTVRERFGDFYKAMFSEQVRQSRMSAVFLEYAWDMAWCDPCAADPLSIDELRRLGVFWIKDRIADVFVTRLHVRYDAQHFPDDLVFQETGDRSNFQARYILRHPWTGTSNCEAASAYKVALAARQTEEEKNLAQLTGWKEKTVKPVRVIEKKWWEW